jgi:hypothetical protein
VIISIGSGYDELDLDMAPLVRQRKQSNGKREVKKLVGRKLSGMGR